MDTPETSIFTTTHQQKEKHQMGSSVLKRITEVVANYETICKYIMTTEGFGLSDNDLSEMDAIDIGVFFSTISKVKGIDFLVVEDDEYEDFLGLYSGANQVGLYCFSCDEVRDFNPDAHKWMHHPNDDDVLIFPAFSSLPVSDKKEAVEQTTDLFCPMAMV